jgi:BolA protein
MGGARLATLATERPENAKKLMTVAETIEAKLKAALAPVRLAIVDESHRHAGHAGARPEGETHFRVEIVADAFTGLSRVARHRLVTSALAEELAGPVHALGLKTMTPAEAAAD